MMEVYPSRGYYALVAISPGDHPIRQIEQRRMMEVDCYLVYVKVGETSISHFHKIKIMSQLIYNFCFLLKQLSEILNF